MDRTNADYVWFVDADDRLFVRPVEDHLSELNGVDVASFACGFEPEADMLDRLLHSGRITAKLFRRRFLTDNAIRFPEAYSSEDTTFGLKVAELHGTQGRFPEPIYEVIRREDSLMHGTFNPRWITRWSAIGEMLRFARQNPRAGLARLERESVAMSLSLTWAYYRERGRQTELLILLPRLIATLRQWGVAEHLDVFTQSGSRRNRMAKQLALAFARPLSRYVRPFVE